MKFLLFFVSMVFSVIFYIFAKFSDGKDILGNTINNYIGLKGLSPNLLIESFVFLFIGILFLYYFSSFSKKGDTNLVIYKKNEKAYFLYYILLLFYIYFFNSGFDNYIIIILIIFILSDIIFNHLANIKGLSLYKIKLRYIGLILNYISSLFVIYYILIQGLDFIPVFILLFNIIFNIMVHKKYINYFSLLISILSIIFLGYSLFDYITKTYLTLI